LILFKQTAKVSKFTGFPYCAKKVTFDPKFNIKTVDKCLVIIPTYNEKENAEKMIRKVFSLPTPFHLLIIEDNSPDGTASIVKRLQGEFSERLFMIERQGKLGLGTAYIAGFKWATENSYDYIFEMDCDFSHNPDDLERLYKAAIDGADVAIGSRYISGINVVNWPLSRVLMSYGASFYVRLVTGMRVKDTTAGFKCYRRKVLDTIDFGHIKMKGYGFQIEMKFTAWKSGFKIVEVPIVFIDRKEGSSKMSGGIFSEALWGVLKMKVNSWFKEYKKSE
jgi:dolichol-phosphate mannosyltransferase